MTLNHELIKKRCQEISDSLERLENIKNLTKEEFMRLFSISCKRIWSCCGNLPKQSQPFYNKGKPAFFNRLGKKKVPDEKITALESPNHRGKSEMA